MLIPKETVDEILRKSRIEEVVGDYVSLRPRGDRLWGLSPFKPEKTPSFSVRPDKNLFYCFSTKKGGGVVDFIMEMEHLSYPEALHFLAKKYSIDISYEDARFSDEYRQKKSLQELYRKLESTFHHMLVKHEDGKTARDYLVSRSVDEDSIAAFRLGYVPKGDWLWEFLCAKDYGKDFLGQSGLFSRNNPKFCLFSGRLVFPIMDISGNTMAFGGRTLDDDRGPKYINSPETAIYHKSQSLFGLWQAKDAMKSQNECIVCEGYMDVIALHQAGVKNALAPLGTAFTSEQAAIVKRLSGKVVLVFDNDEAGQTATEKAVLTCEKSELSLEVVRVEGQKDPADILLKDGSQGVKKMLNSRLHAFEYLASRIRKGLDIGTPTGISAFMTGVQPYLEAIVSPVRKESVVNYLSDILGVSTSSIQQETARRIVRPRTEAQKVGAGSEDQPVARVASRRPDTGKNSQMDFGLLLAVALNPDLYGLLRTGVALEDLRHPLAQELFICLEECFRNGDMAFLSVVQRAGDGDLGQLLLRKQSEGEYSAHQETFVRKGILRIRERNLFERRNSIRFQLKKISQGSPRDEKLERDLLEETATIDEALKELRKRLDDGTAE